MITIVIADDQPLVRQGLRMRLALEEDMKIIGAAQDGNNALDVVLRLKPDVVIMDLEMPVMDGLAATRQLQSLAPDCGVIMLTIHDDEANHKQALEAGAAGFVSKHMDDIVLLNTIRALVKYSNGNK